MNDTERAALIEELTALATRGSTNVYAIMATRSKVTELIDTYITANDEEPVADAVDLMGHCLWDAYVDEEETYPAWGQLDERAKQPYLRMARASLSAVPTEEPRWWVWMSGAWGDPVGRDKGAFGSKFYDTYRVYGTTANRDAKRDALMEAIWIAGPDEDD